MNDSASQPDPLETEAETPASEDGAEGEVTAEDANGVTAEAGEPVGDTEAPAPDVEAPQPAVDDSELQRRYDELNDRHLRLAAEFNNYRRRSEQERLEVWTRAQADLLERLLEVLDDLHRVADLDLTNATVEAIMEGIDLVEKKFVRVLNDLGMEMIDPAGDVFDPERMEAMMRVPTDSEAEDDMVAQVFQKGYSLKGILVRPARVSVHKHG